MGLMGLEKRPICVIEYPAILLRTEADVHSVLISRSTDPSVGTGGYILLSELMLSVMLELTPGISSNLSLQLVSRICGTPVVLLLRRSRHIETDRHSAFCFFTQLSHLERASAFLNRLPSGSALLRRCSQGTLRRMLRLSGC